MSCSASFAVDLCRRGAEFPPIPFTSAPLVFHPEATLARAITNATLASPEILALAGG